MPSKDEIIISENPTKKVGDDEELEPINRKELAILLRSHDFESVKVVGEKYRMQVVFVRSEVKDLIDQYASGKTIMVDYSKLVAATNWWNDTVSLWRSKV